MRKPSHAPWPANALCMPAPRAPLIGGCGHTSGMKRDEKSNGLRVKFPPPVGSGLRILPPTGTSIRLQS